MTVRIKRNQDVHINMIHMINHELTVGLHITYLTDAAQKLFNGRGQNSLFVLDLELSRQ